jgi:hypothetical protein
MCFMSGAAYDESTKGKIFKGSLIVSAGLSLTIGGKRSTGEVLTQVGAGLLGFVLGSLYKSATGH